MVSANYNPSGFSYAQAARGRAPAALSQTPSSKVTSGTTSASASILSDVNTPRSNWADDVEGAAAAKTGEVQKSQGEEQRSSQAKHTPADSIKSDDKFFNGASGISSPDLTSSSSTTKEFELVSPPDGSSSDGAWEIVSQTSEPSWIADRKERQSTSQNAEKPTKDEKKSSTDDATQTTPKLIIMQEAPPPMVNPWTKRAEEAKAKASALPPPAVAVPVSNAAPPRENQRPRSDPRRTPASVASAAADSMSSSGEDLRKDGGAQAKRANDTRKSAPRVDSDPKPESIRTDAAPQTSTRSIPTERQSLPNMSSSSQLLNDESSWPTPDSAQEKERKETVEKESDEKRDDDATPTTKRKKQEWKILPVTPSIKFETIMNEPKGRSRASPNGERGGRGGNGSRGRGGFRGGSNGITNPDRQSSRSGSSPTNRNIDSSVDMRERPNTSGNTSIPSKPKRASSASSWRDGKLAGRSPNVDNAPLDRSNTNPDESGISSANGQAKPPTSESNAARTQSPKKIDPTGSQTKSDEVIPKPIPRRNSSGAQTQQPVDGVDGAPRNPGATRSVTADGRKDSRAFENPREPNGPTHRGARRGGRGRGGNGSRELANGHGGNHAYPGNYPAEFVGPSPYGVLQSASPYQAQRGHHHLGYAVQGRPVWNGRGGMRSQSIHLDTNYFQRTGQYPPGSEHQLPPIQTYVPSMMDPNGVPMTAVPYPNQMDPQFLIQTVATQLEYYFSVDNLLKDMFLRKHMDSQGFVFIDVVTNFNRIRQLTQDKDIVRAACMNSDIIEIRLGDDGKERLRKAEGWEQFLLPMEQREESAQTNGPEHVQRLERPQLQITSPPQQFRGPASAGVPSMQQARYDRRSYDSVYPVMNGMPPQYGSFGGIPEVMYGDMNDEEMRGRAAKSPIHESPMSPLGQPMDSALEEADFEPDAFPEEQVAVLTVVVKMSQQQRLPYHNLSSRTFSNGSIDTRTIMSEMDKPADGASQPKKDGPPIVNGSDHKLPPIPLRRPSPNKTRSGERAPNNSDLDVFWVKDQEVPVANLPSDLTSEPYAQLRLKALDQRSHAATGTCPYDMDVLYQFWCHFLIRNFNNRMYTEFMTLANEDARQRHNLIGIQNLMKFYDQSLRSTQYTIRARVVKDYVKLIRSEPPELQGTVFKQLRTAWRDGALPIKNRKKVLSTVDEKFKQQLEGLH